MAKFNVKFQTDSSHLNVEKEAGDTLTIDDLLNCLRPAALRLVEAYKATIRNYFNRRTGSFEDSIEQEDWNVRNDASIMVRPAGKHKGGNVLRKSKAGPADRRYAKHNREVDRTLKNEELGYYFEVGTPRIAATHWMENTNEEVAEEIQDMIETEFDNLLRKKGLIE